MDVDVRQELCDGRIRIRRCRAADADALYEAARESIAEAGRWVPWCHADYSRDQSEQWLASRPEAWRRGEAYSFFIEDAQTGRLLGGCGLNTIDWANNRANLGYWVRSSATGRGVATAAARLLLAIGFEDLGLQRIEIVSAVENLGSRRVAQKAGAKEEGILRKRFLLGGEPHDAVMHSVIAEDLPEGEAEA
ncbi:MAG: GNAT family N-acetyltransferase [Planctomycetota bacterium]|jgi:RimJ/RimL family protein N-acetyltransferase